jgi:hypothetical protein
MSTEQHPRPYLVALLRDLARPISEEERLAIAKLLERDEQAVQRRSGRHASIATVEKSYEIASQAERLLLTENMGIKSVAHELGVSKRYLEKAMAERNTNLIILLRDCVAREEDPKFRGAIMPAVERLIEVVSNDKALKAEWRIALCHARKNFRKNNPHK